MHAIVWDLPGGDGGLREAALPPAAAAEQAPAMGRNSCLRAGWLPPGHAVALGRLVGAYERR